MTNKDVPDVKQKPNVQICSPQFQAILLRSKENNNLSAINTARKSSVEAKGICPGCGIRVNRSEMAACDNCGVQICRKCFNQQNDKEILAEEK